MRVAVMSDIHGFSLALDTVLADLERHGPFDEVVVAGDLAENGPDPAGVLQRLRQRDFTVLQGNTDYDVVAAARAARAPAELRYVIEQIGDDGVRWLAGLPFSRRLTPPGGRGPADDLLIVHANPHDQVRKMSPEASDRELMEIIGETEAAAIAFGHIHIAYQRRLPHVLLVDVSAVGNPKDRDLRCKYGIVSWNQSSGKWSAEIQRLSYPLAETADQIMASGLPDPEQTRRKLEAATY